jgi:predicted site-specific integrase-resolvase
MRKVKETYKNLLDKVDSRSIVRVDLGEFEQEFAEDIVALVASYSARL